MDNDTLIKLEFDKIQKQVAGLSCFEGGRNIALTRKPSSDEQEIRRWLDEVEEAMEALRYGETGFLSGLELLDNYLDKARWMDCCIRLNYIMLGALICGSDGC